MKKANKVIGIILLTLAAAAAAAGIAVAMTCTGRAAVSLTALPDPMDTVSLFFDSVCSRDYGTAVSCLDDYSSLGLENTPEDAQAALLWETVRAHTSWEPAGECAVSGTEASVTVNLTYPDLTRLTAGLEDDVLALVEQRVEEASTVEDIYDENKNYRTEFILGVYADALGSRLAQADLPYCTEMLTVNLNFTDSAWKIQPDEALLLALSGTGSGEAEP